MNCYKLIVFILVAFLSCKSSDSDSSSFSGSLFTLLDAEHTGVKFNNIIKDSKDEHLGTFNYIYNGAGVAIVDINNDGLQDLYFTGNQVKDKLYLNKGDFKFEDISSASGIDKFDGWHNSVSTVDINNDGYMDIYICRGAYKNINSINKNILFINNKNNTFTEMAEKYGIADEGYSIASSFFDYDNDGDLDLVVSNRPDHWPVSPEEILKTKADKNADIKTTTRLYSNQGNGTFVDKSLESGILPNYSYALSTTTGDVNNDGMQDIYIANDFIENDYFFINVGNGKFSNMIKNVTNHVPYYSMGTDFGDINNDGNEEIFTVEMRPDDYKRSKVTMPLMQPQFFSFLKVKGFHDQYMHNMLQYNHGNGYFSDISQLSGVDKTDWSWAALISDFDNDGWKDIFVSNGYLRDVYDRDHSKEIEEMLQAKDHKVDSVEQVFGKLPSVKLVNYIFQNNRDLTFSKKMKEWGLKEPSFSNGAAVGDLDNDGDLDMVINNINDPAFIYKNNSTKNNYLRVKLHGQEGNLHGIGAKATIYHEGKIQYVELRTSRGYLSSSENIIHFGLGNSTTIDSLIIKWDVMQSTKLVNIKSNQVLTLDYKDSKPISPTLQNELPKFIEYTSSHFRTPFYHRENAFDDYKDQKLLPSRMSALGPFISVGDVNNDQLEDFFIGAAHQQLACLYVQNDSGIFNKANIPIFEKDKLYEDLGSVFFDCDKDGDQDLYVVSGGTEIAGENPIYQDRLYINQGNGVFKKDISNLPEIRSSGMSVSICDFDHDGDIDIFRGGRIIPNKYPFPPLSYLLENKGNGVFIDVTESKAIDLRNIGMVTSSVFVDIDGDKKEELVLVGEWMPITIFKSKDGKWIKMNSEELGLSNTEGWWNTVNVSDLDDDGDQDLLCGNIGQNYKFHASIEKPFKVYCDDYDKNGSYDIILAKYNGKDLVPVRGRQCSSEQIPSVAEKFKTYNAFANAKIEDIIGDKMSQGIQLEAREFSSVILINSNGKFNLVKMPIEAQFSAVQSLIVEDFNDDNIKDIIVAGNLFNSEIETTKADASIGLLMYGDKKLNFLPQKTKESGIFMPWNVKDIKPIKLYGKTSILVASNDSPLYLFRSSK